MSNPSDDNADLGAAGAAEDFIDVDRLSGIYLRAVEAPVLTRAALANAGYTDEEIDRATTVFEWRGLIKPIDDTSWQVLPPDVAMPTFASRLEEHARQLRASAPHIARIYQRGLDEQTGPPRGLVQLRGTADLQHAVQGVVASCSTTLRVIRADTPFTRHTLQTDASTAAVTNAAGEPLDIRVVYDLSLLDEPGMLDLLARRAEQGEQQRLAPAIPFSLAVSDAGRVVVDMFADDNTPVGILLTTEAGARAADSFFDLVWRLATPPHADSATGTDARDTQIVRLLAGGATDSLIARQLGISQRTVERRVRAYMERVNAVTRFQAGVQAAKQGLL